MRDRLKAFLELEGLSVRQFENIIGSSDGKIAKFIQTNSSLKSDTLCKIMEFFPQLSITWLLTGNGSMLISEEATSNDDEYSKVVKDRLRLVLSFSGNKTQNISSNITISAIGVILNAIPDLSTEWLFRGVGSPYKNEQPISVEKLKDIEKRLAALEDEREKSTVEVYSA